MMDDLTAFQRDILYVIGGLDDEEPPYGLAIKEELDRHYSGEINHGRLYPNLNDLAEMGLVEKGSVDDRTNSYILTERGHREIEARREWEDEYVAVEA
jgi:DNA-binding PadR family transcriptional regulator